MHPFPLKCESHLTGRLYRSKKPMEMDPVNREAFVEVTIESEAALDINKKCKSGIAIV